MPLQGVQRIIKAKQDEAEQDGIDFEIAEREEEEEFGYEDGGELRGSGTALKSRGTPMVLTILYDEFGNERPVPRGARSHYTGKRREDPVTGKKVRVFFEQLPKAFRDPKTGKRKALVENVDYLPCPTGRCPIKIQLDQDMRLPGAISEEQRAFSLAVAKDEHIRVFHPRQYIYYANTEIRARREAIAKN